MFPKVKRREGPEKVGRRESPGERIGVVGRRVSRGEERGRWERGSAGRVWVREGKGSRISESRGRREEEGRERAGVESPHPPDPPTGGGVGPTPSPPPPTDTETETAPQPRFPRCPKPPQDRGRLPPLHPHPPTRVSPSLPPPDRGVVGGREGKTTERLPTPTTAAIRGRWGGVADDQRPRPVLHLPPLPVGQNG